jgi:DNA-binding response OmpR family regulator
VGDRRSTPIIALTAATSNLDRQRLYEAGVDDFMYKPARQGELKAKLLRWARERNQIN